MHFSCTVFKFNIKIVVWILSKKKKKTWFGWISLIGTTKLSKTNSTLLKKTNSTYKITLKYCTKNKGKKKKITLKWKYPKKYLLELLCICATYKCAFILYFYNEGQRYYSQYQHLKNFHSNPFHIWSWWRSLCRI